MNLDDLWEVPEDADVPPLDRTDASPQTENQKTWVEKGVVVLPKFLPEALIDDYCEAWKPEFSDTSTLYQHNTQALELCTYGPLSDILEELIGEPMGVHLNLVRWVTTERDWHQDDYLNPPFINGHYVAVWMALSDIHPDSGPFQYLEGSHKWPIIRREKMLTALGEPFPQGNDTAWPTRSEAILSPLFEEKIANEGLSVTTYIPKKGDVLIWHSRLTHRGSKAKVPGMERRAMIAHYSAIAKRLDMPSSEQHGRGWFFHLPGAI